MRIWPFRRSREEEDAARLLAAVQAASRRPVLFGEGRIPDSLQGRFELMTLTAALALIRLREDAGAAALAQAFTDQLFRHFDAGLREAGVGDLTVPKRMRVLAGAFYGRLEAYANAVAAADAAQLAQALERNTGVSEAFAAPLAAHALDVALRQAQTPVATLFDPNAWPEFAE